MPANQASERHRHNKIQNVIERRYRTFYKQRERDNLNRVRRHRQYDGGTKARPRRAQGQIIEHIKAFPGRSSQLNRKRVRITHTQNRALDMPIGAM